MQNGDDRPQHPSELKKGEVNPYIPKYIAAKPWYQGGTTDKEDDYLAHQRKNPEEIIDYSEAKAGQGIQDEFDGNGEVRVKKNEDYVSKRDRWYGYELKQWESVLANWEDMNRKRRKKQQQKGGESYDSDDTDYELELVELGLDRKDLRTSIKEDPLEQTIRDRQDVPSYIYNITSNPGNKIRIEYDPKSRLAKDLTKGFLNDDTEFVRKQADDGISLTEVQRFAWEEDNKKKKQARADVGGGDEVPEANPDFNVEASPTLMMLKAKQHKDNLLMEASLKKQALKDKYGIANAPERSLVKEIGIDQTPISDNDHNGLKRTIYAEDKYDLNHTAVFGSYYEDGKWGYKCCRQTIRNVFCNKNE
ncbi:uncharacterized protein CANTADRAFT_6475 [Suhomyces tanzawaensis NRRL Y-17324]|uniref:Pre-mRNA-splicing factor SLU7 n=1 Tax=Suhomyces tanzawaensis NRRL Y-17324 TaxID=984487 RepID=A0A1E4SIR7_9ASCO|nr:uncharacterized protein CANTADRAFT_6475 [Suhomyces tanzawaensis NRRL Y-17324]ODV79337.1 hypothetical protein CANTADRAFT_6475 [Suhomyces tanzawaensis NRRL Y-17324]